MRWPGVQQSLLTSGSSEDACAQSTEAQKLLRPYDHFSGVLAQPGIAARDPSRHHQHGQCNPTALTQGRRRHMGLEALEKCYTVHCGLLRRLRVEVVVDYNSTPRSPFKLAHFGEGIGYIVCYNNTFANYEGLKQG